MGCSSVPSQRQTWSSVVMHAGLVGVCAYPILRGDWEQLLVQTCGALVISVIGFVGTSLVLFPMRCWQERACGAKGTKCKPIDVTLSLTVSLCIVLVNIPAAIGFERAVL
eukprot:2128051-Amphidinium_carterae.1